MSLEKAFTDLVFKGFKGEALAEFVEVLKEADKSIEWLNCLEAAGVDNWEGCEYAQEMMSDEEDDDE